MCLFNNLLPNLTKMKPRPLALWFIFTIIFELYCLNIYASVPASPDSLLNLIKSFSTEELLLDSLVIIMDDFQKENSEAYLKAFDDGIQYYKSIHKDTAVAHLVYAKSHLFLQQSQYPEALVSFNESLALYEEISFNKLIGMCYYHMAWIHHKQKNFAQFLAYAKLASKYFQTIPESYDTCTGIMTLAIAYYLNDSLDHSLHYFKEYYSMANRILDTHHIAQALGKLGSFYENSEGVAALDSARKYYELEWEAAKKDSSGRALLMAGIDMGSLEKEDKNYDMALYYFNLSLEKADQLKKYYEKQWIERSIAETYALAGKYDKAYDTFRSYAHFKDSIFSEEKNLQVTELEKKYETEKKDKQITVLAKEKEIQATLKKGFLGGFVLMSMLAVLLVYIFRQRIKNQKLLTAKNEEVKEVNFKQQLSELEMKALRAQINPHFLFNCMNSINRMILNDESENASRYLTKFSKLVRSILENSETPTVSLENELAMLETYIQLEALRFKGKINYQIVLDEFIEPESTYLPSMVLQPFVENAIWHGLMHKETEDKGMITIAIREDEDRLLCTIEDNGVGREKARVLQEKSVLKSKSMGMKITEERLRLLSKEQMAQLVRITDLKDAMDFARGTRVEINIPIS